MKLTSPQTYKVVRFALERGFFKQLEAHKATGVSFALVNSVTRWLVSRKFVAQEHGGYRVIAPAALAQSFSLFRQMDDLRTGTFSIDADAPALRKFLDERGAVYCLSSALPLYDDYFHDPTLHVYGSPALGKALRELPSSSTTLVYVYADDLQDGADIVKRNGARYTAQTRTIIDLLCSERAYAADRLIKKTWG